MNFILRFYGPPVLSIPLKRLNSTVYAFLKNLTFTSECCYLPDAGCEKFALATEIRFDFHNLSKLLNMLLALPSRHLIFFHSFFTARCT